MVSAEQDGTAGAGERAAAGPTSFHVRRAKAGDEASLAWVVERFGPLLLAQARYRLRGPLGRHVEAEDLVNEVWAVALPALSALRPAGERETPTLLRFLSTTLLYRRNALARRALARGAAAASASLDRLPARTRGVVSRAMGEEAARLVAAAIEELPARDREVLVLRAIEQRPNAEVAALLGDTPNAVSLRYGRALARLARRLPGSLLAELGPEPAEGPPKA